MINVLFFARVRELAGCSDLGVAAGYPDVDALHQHLVARDGRFALALEKEKLLVAVNQTLVPFSHPLNDGDEVAFFPPVTGG
ncbi:molybdopterin synthase sulfur carrier subunit [Tatumella terrea]|uniref:Molybdopterin synthase sulfur carrier subunit n=1 Tax=Tatumella terrea TaxID=419007 RepID=A0ABW1VXN4_9GAMM|nr:molybdopterin synthase sulfur carrier subunit [Tatumella sp. JGM118]MBS0909734.1 molybdopterin synthase sulfur carrier subunit [Tatumella sp. JGM118]